LVTHFLTAANKNSSLSASLAKVQPVVAKGATTATGDLENHNNVVSQRHQSEIESEEETKSNTNNEVIVGAEDIRDPSLSFDNNKEDATLKGMSKLHFLLWGNGNNQSNMDQSSDSDDSFENFEDFFNYRKKEMDDFLERSVAWDRRNERNDVIESNPFDTNSSIFASQSIKGQNASKLDDVLSELKRKKQLPSYETSSVEELEMSNQLRFQKNGCTYSEVEPFNLATETLHLSGTPTGDVELGHLVQHEASRPSTCTSSNSTVSNMSTITASTAPPRVSSSTDSLHQLPPARHENSKRTIEPMNYFNLEAAVFDIGCSSDENDME